MCPSTAGVPVPPPEIAEIHARSILTPQGRESILTSYDFSLNPYQGCGMGCSYCYVMSYPFAVDHPLEWGEWVRPKVNAPHLLAGSRRTVWGKRVFVSSATDPYQYIERDYRLTRRCLQVLLECNLSRLTIHTRSHLVLDDLDLLQSFGHRAEVGFSIPTDDDRVRKRLEPKAPTIGVRLKTMRTLRDAGIRVTAAVSPVFYCHPERFARALSGAADRAWVDRARYERKTDLKGNANALAFLDSARYRSMVQRLRWELQGVGLIGKAGAFG
jgi:DNA repair photolyase